MEHTFPLCREVKLVWVATGKINGMFDFNMDMKFNLWLAECFELKNMMFMLVFR